MTRFHTPVMSTELINSLKVRKNCWYIDGTLGGGGHSSKVLEKGGKVIGLDQDPDSIKYCSEKFNLPLQNLNGQLLALSNSLILYQTNFSKLKDAVKTLKMLQNFYFEISGIFYDLGISSHQIETPNRGFSFNFDEVLDMRMDPTHQTITAQDLVNGLYEKELIELFQKLGEEKSAKEIAREIIKVRSIQKIITTKQLSDIALSVKKHKEKIHPATKIFQALRIAVNDEINSLKDSLPQALEIITNGSTIAVISFHSLEDRAVKTFFNEEQKRSHMEILTKKPITPSNLEIKKNYRSHSAKLRVGKKLMI